MDATVRATLLLSVLFGATGATATETFDTGSTGSNAPFSNLQPSVVINYFVQEFGVFPSLGPGSSPDVYYQGMVRSSAGTSPGLSANGQLRAISENSPLFSLYGANFGGDGRSTFGLPNLAGVAPRHNGGTSQIGHTAGESMSTLEVSHLPVHSHGIPGISAPTSEIGGGESFSNLQPSQRLNYIINLNGDFPDRHSPGDGGPFIGQVALFGGNFAPRGWAFANGQSMSLRDSSTHPLFSLLGTTYGGDGRTDFLLPDLRDRIVVGANGSHWRLGETRGDAEVTLSIDEMPEHGHSLPTPFDMTDTAGGSLLPSNVEPSMALNYLIATAGVYPSFDRISEETMLGEVTLFAGNFAPGGWAIADGQVLPISGNEALFSLLGTNFGGDGETTFALPDLRGRAAIGAGTGADGIRYDIGDEVGAMDILLGLDNLPAHFHAATVPLPAGLPIFGLALVVLGRYRRRALFS